MRTEKIKLSDIRNIESKELDNRRLDTLQNEYTKFEELLENNTSTKDPIMIDKSVYPYAITDGRHRIFLARQKGYTHILCAVQG